MRFIHVVAAVDVHSLFTALSRAMAAAVVVAAERQALLMAYSEASSLVSQAHFWLAALSSSGLAAMFLCVVVLFKLNVVSSKPGVSQPICMHSVFLTVPHHSCTDS
jgi:hypothetical protein